MKKSQCLVPWICALVVIPTVFLSVDVHAQALVKAVGHIAVMDGSGKVVKGKSRLSDRDVLKTFYGVNEAGPIESFRGDHYDIIAFYANFPVNAPGAFAYSVNVRNDILNIGLGEFNDSDFFGSAGNLNSYLFMNDLDEFPDDPTAPIVSQGFNYGHQVLIAHESTHLMCCYVSSTDGTIDDGAAHWSYLWDTDGSYMHGAEWMPDPLTISDFPHTFTADVPFVQFSAFDRYLWGDFDGLGDAELLAAVAPRGLLTAPGESTSTEAQAGDMVEANDVTEISLDSVIAAEGGRRDDPEQQTAYRMAIILVVEEGTVDTITPDHPDIVKLETFRKDFECVFNTQMETVSMDTTLEGIADDGNACGDVIDQNPPDDGGDDGMDDGTGDGDEGGSDGNGNSSNGSGCALVRDAVPQSPLVLLGSLIFILIGFRIVARLTSLS